MTRMRKLKEERQVVVLPESAGGGGVRETVVFLPTRLLQFGAVGIQLVLVIRARFILIKRISNTAFCPPHLAFIFMWLTLLRIYVCHGTVQFDYRIA